MSYALNETKLAISSIESPSLGKSPYDTLRRVARYYIDEGQSRDSVRKSVEEYITLCDKSASIVKWDKTINAAIQYASRHEALNIGSIPITESELTTINSAVGSQSQRLAFTLLCLSKYWNKRNGVESFWVNSKDSDIMQMANIKTSIRRQSKLYHDLREAGMISFSHKIDCNHVRVEFADNNSNTAMEITDLRNLGNQYLMHIGQPYFKCAECGIVSKMSSISRGRHRKYCVDCAYKVQKRRSAEWAKNKNRSVKQCNRFVKDIEGYEGLYAITSCGRVWSYKKNGFLTQCADANGYLVVGLHKDGCSKHYSVHRLVAQAYIPNPNQLPFVNHKDEYKDHNWVSNLEWCDAAYNNNYGTGHLKFNRKVRCVDTDEIYNSITDAANANNIVPYYFYDKVRRNKAINGRHYEFIKIEK